ncbi:peptidylprolyl isomerase [Formosa sp. S-31]|uniref:peptidylprolyl isomerase n=1 Tax=Formosa sp. S-31 TaxID=2790949 RepID=UPI003EB8F940
MKLKSVFLALFMVCSVAVKAQISSEDVLFTVDQTPVYASEFLRVYNKNLDLVKDESQKNVDNYLELFINYKLKIQEARALGLDNKQSYKRELSAYRKQLAKNYLTDTKVTDELIQEAYNRLKYDVKARHILVRVDENASPKDTLAAYIKIVKLRKQLIDDGFESVQKNRHDGKTVYAENLGWFSAFRMVYPFETAAYNTTVGDVSQPFRTQFGYHVVQTQDKRASRGEVTVAHIMVANVKPGDSLYNPESRINDIYKKLNQGEDFEMLAKQFSDDKNTAIRGGRLDPFSGGQISSEEFENQAFGISEIGSYSKPFQTNFGWHVVKLLDKKPLPLFYDYKPELEDRVKQDSRSKLIDESRYQNLVKRYHVDETFDALPYFAGLLNKSYYENTWELPASFKGDATLVKIDSKVLTYGDFGAYLKLHQQRFNSDKVKYKAIVAKQYKTFLETEVLNYQEENLEHESVDFANIMSEYRDGLLLFDLMETQIWNVANTDTTAIKKYYEANKNKYVWKKRIDAIVASSADKKDIKTVSKLLKKNVPLEEIKNLVNVNDEVHVIFTSGIMEVNHPGLPEHFEFKKGRSKIYDYNEGYIVAEVKQVLPESPKSFEEAKGNVISDFQTEKEDQWIQDLHAKYTVSVNQSVLTQVRNEINNNQ